MGAYQEHYPALSAGMAGKLDSYTPSPKHWNPGYLIEGAWGGSHNHGVAEAACAMLSGKRSDALAVAVWWARYFDLSRQKGLATGEPRSGIYMELIAASVIGARVGAKRHDLDSLAGFGADWFDAFLAQSALATFPARTKGRFTVHRPKEWGMNRGHFEGSEAETWTCIARGQRSWGRTSSQGGVPHGGEMMTGCPTFGSVNQLIHRAITGQLAWGFGGEDSPWPHVPMFVHPDTDYAFDLKAVVDGRANEATLRRVLAKCWPQYDGCTMVRFERGSLCVTHRKTHSATAAMYAAVIHKSGETEWVALDPGNRSATTGGKAGYDSKAREVVAIAARNNETIVLPLPDGRYGKELWRVDFPAGQLPILTMPGGGVLPPVPPVEPPQPPEPPPVEPPVPPVVPPPTPPPTPPPPGNDEEDTLDKILKFIEEVDIDKLERIVTLAQAVLKMLGEIDPDMLAKLLRAWKETT